MKKEKNFVRRPPKPSVNQEVLSKPFLPPIKPPKRDLLDAPGKIY